MTADVFATMPMAAVFSPPAGEAAGGKAIKCKLRDFRGAWHSTGDARDSKLVVLALVETIARCRASRPRGWQSSLVNTTRRWSHSSVWMPINRTLRRRWRGSRPARSCRVTQGIPCGSPRARIGRVLTWARSDCTIILEQEDTAVMFSIDATDPTPLYAQLERAIRVAIATGRLQRGDRLPTVRQLAVDLRVNANTVAKVYAELERAGVLETQRGVGTFVHTATSGASSLLDRHRPLTALADRFLTDAATLGFSADEALAFLKNRLTDLKRGKSDGRQERR